MARRRSALRPVVVAFAALAIVLIVLNFVYKPKVHEPSVEREQRQRQSLRIWGDLDRMQILSLRIIGSNGLLVAAQDEEGYWWIEQPAHEPPVIGVLSSALTNLTRLKAERRLDGVSDEQLEQYGLNPPQTEIRIMVKEEQEPRILHWGRKVPGSRQYYARIPGEDLVYILPSRLHNLTALPPHEFRVRKWFEDLVLRAPYMSRIELTYPAVSMRLEKSDAGWRLSAPSEAPVDLQSWEQFWEKLKAITIFDFVVDGARFDRAAYNLDQPFLTMTFDFHVPQREPRSVTLELGRVEPETEGELPLIYGWRSDRPGSVVRLDPRQENLLAYTPAWFRDRKVFRFEVEEVHELRLGNPAGAWELRRDDDGWQGRQLEGDAEWRGVRAADAERIVRYFSWLRTMPTLPASDESLERAGLIDPSDWAEIDLEDGRTVKLGIGKPYGGGFVYAKASTRPRDILVFAQRDLPAWPNETDGFFQPVPSGAE